MANSDVITRLKMETTQYDSKLRDAAQKLKEFGREADKAGADFQKLSKENMELAKSFGTIGTSATNNKDKLKELVNAYNDVAKAYNNLTKEQQQSDIGKVLGQSLDQLKGRISETKQELQNVGDKMKDTKSGGESLGGMLDSIAGKFGVNVKALGTLGAALAAGKVALDVAKDAFFSSESQVDEWGRTVAASESVYNAFVNALNNASFSGFFSRMDSIIQKARDAYDAMDRLNTVMTIINPERAKLQARQGQLREIIRREGKDSAAGKQAQQDLLALEPKLKASYRTEAGLNWNAFEKAVQQRLAEGGINLDAKSYKFLMQTFHDENAYKRLEQHARGSKTVLPGKYMGTTQSGMAMYQSGGVVDTRNTDKKLMDLFTDKWRQKYSPYLTASFSAIGSAASVGLQNTRYVAGGGGGGGRSGGGSGTGGGTPTYVPVAGSIDARAALVAKLQKAWRAAADDDSRTKIKEQLDAASKVLDAMQGKMEAPVGSMKYYQQQLTELQQKQQEVTTNNEWEYYAGQIDFVNKKMKELRGEVEQLATGTSGATGAAIGDWISAQQQSLSGMEFGAGASQVYANIIDAKTLENLLNYALENDISISPDSVESLWDQIIGGDNIPDSVWENLEETINSMLAEMDLDPINIDVNTGSISKGAKVVEEGWKDAAAAVQSVGNALQQIEDPGAKIAGLIGEAIANIALGFAQATASDSKLGVFGWIAAIAGGLGTMLGTISAIKSATAGSYAEGGIIPGNNHNDGLIAAVSSGELILNRAQQNSIANQLQGGAFSNIQIVGVLEGENIVLAANRVNRRKGKGEYAYTKSR